VNNFVDYAARFGLSLRKPNDLSLALGTEEVTLSELVSAYTPFANNGSRSEARTILKIYDYSKQAWTDTQPAVTTAVSPATAFVTTDILRDVLTYGTAKSQKKLSQERPTAGKTGTTDDYKDAWFVGYTPQLVTGVWVGHDKPRSGGRGFTGGAVAAPIWGQYMRSAQAGRPAVDFQRPDTVVTVAIDPATGKLAAPDCPFKRDEVFISGTEPSEYCPKHGGELLPPLPRQLPMSSSTSFKPAEVQKQGNSN
jgi:membrane carboxypeptidase/penicillin-binding protein